MLLSCRNLQLRWVIVALALLPGCARFHPQPLSPASTAAKLEERSLASPELKTFLENYRQHELADWPLKSWEFEDLTIAALYYHPSLEVARAQWRVALGGNKTAAGRPNPTLNAIPGYDFSATGGVNPWIPGVSLDIPIETAGKRGYRMALAQNLGEAARLNIAAAAWQVRANLRASLIDLAAANRREQLLANQTKLQEQLVKSLEEQFQAGEISTFELSQARITRSKTRLDLAEARRLQADARVSVADAIGLPVQALENVSLDYDLAARPANAEELTSAEARGQALQRRADILAGLAEYAASQSALQLEIAKQYPDLHLGPGYQFDQGDHKFTFGLTVELPILNQNQGPIAEAEAKRGESAARFVALQAKVITEIDRAAAAYRVTRENLFALESLSSEQQKQAQLVEAQMKAGAAARMDLVNAQLELASGELVRLDAQVRQQQALAALEGGLQSPGDAVRPAVLEQAAAQSNKEHLP
jgi:outer membrane protein TolC